MSVLPARWGEDPRVAQALFAGTFVLGVAGVLALKLLGVPQWAVTLWPIAWMIAYAALVFVPPFRLRPDQTADNVYYLGFLFTLVSLGYSLHQFSLESGLDEVVRNFGIAIASTIAGVFGRVVLTQMRTDPFETERAVRLALTDTSRALRGELDNALIEFTAFRRQMQQTTADGMRELSELAAKEITAAATRFGATVEDATGRIAGVVEVWSTGANRYAEEGAKLVGAMEGLSAGLGAIRAPAELLDEKLQPMAASVSELAVSATSLLGDLKSAGTELKEQGQAMKATVAHAEQIVASSRAHADALKELVELTRLTRDQAQQVSDAVDRSAGRLAVGAESVIASLDALVARLAAEAGRIEDEALEREAAAHATHEIRMTQARHAFASFPARPDAAA